LERFRLCDWLPAVSHQQTSFCTWPM
jgi:hypothetical protein